MEKHTAGKELEDVIVVDISLTSQSILLGFDFVALCQHKERAADVTWIKKRESARNNNSFSMTPAVHISSGSLTYPYLTSL